MYQKLVIVGNLGRDPEMRYMSDGTAVTNLNVATSRSWTNRQTGEKQEETTWFRISVWGKQAETANQYLNKGNKVLIEGRLRPDENGSPRTYTANDGTIRASFEMTAETVRFLSGRNESSAEPAPAPANDNELEMDDIPF